MSNLDKEFNRLQKEIEKESKSYVEKKSRQIVAELIIATPVDTGEARKGWELNLNTDGSTTIVNDVEHIVNLNEGSSKQAPAYFVEQIALNHGKPLGAIVTVKS